MSGAAVAGRSSRERTLGGEEGEERIWKQYFHRLVLLLARKLNGVSRADADEEDVALSAIACFQMAARQGRFRRLDDDGDLWCVLLTIAERKAANRRKYSRRQKRAGHRSEADFAPSGVEIHLIEEAAGDAPTPLVAAIAIEQFERLIESLPDQELRQIALWKGCGYSHGEIAAEIGRTERTVERKVRLIRKRLKQFVEEDDA